MWQFLFAVVRLSEVLTGSYFTLTAA